jgi:glycosyltransferase
LAQTISIITATLNAAETLATCLDSITSQSVPVEHIIIDACSSDGTLDIIRQLSADSIIASEPDKGIYDALNKGIKRAAGDIIGILHADDFYASADVLEMVVEIFANKDIDSCYGDLVYITGDSEKRGAGSREEKHSKIVRYWKSGEYGPKRFYWGWMPPHPTFFVRREVYEKYGLFNLDLGTAADYELMLRFLLKHEISCAYIPEVLVKMRVGGASNESWSNRLQANKMDRKAWEVNGLKPYPWTLWLKPTRKIPQWFRKP